MELTSTLIIKGLGEAADREVTIKVVDVSKTGLGFLCDSSLTIGTVYEARLTIWMKEVINTFLKITRIDKISETEYSYGAVFIGMSDMDASRIAVYDTMDSLEK